MDYVKNRVSAINQWLLTYSHNPAARMRIFCFHYAGGSSSVFSDWHLYLPSQVEVVCVELPGRGARFAESLMSDVDEILYSLKRAISDILDLPFMIFGHSLGAYLGHLLALELMEDGFAAPIHFIPSGRSAPRDKNEYFEKISHLPDCEFLGKLKDYGGIPEELLQSPEFIELYLPIVRADFRISERSAPPEGKLECPISVFCGVDDKIDTANLGIWARETTSECSVSVFPGEHFFIRTAKGEVLKQCSKIIEEHLVVTRVGIQ